MKKKMKTEKKPIASAMVYARASTENPIPWGYKWSKPEKYFHDKNFYKKPLIDQETYKRIMGLCNSHFAQMEHSIRSQRARAVWARRKQEKAN